MGFFPTVYLYQWERNEITNAFKIISKRLKLNAEIINKLSLSLDENYLPIIRNILEIFLNSEITKKEIIKKVLNISENKDKLINKFFKKP